VIESAGFLVYASNVSSGDTPIHKLGNKPGNVLRARKRGYELFDN
jgi:hypothetical protein